MITVRAYYDDTECLWGSEVVQDGQVIHQGPAIYLNERAAKQSGINWVGRQAVRTYFCPQADAWGFEIYRQGAVIYRSSAGYPDDLSAKFEGRKKANTF